MPAIEAFTVGGSQYRANAMPAFDQMVVAKRLLPAIKYVLTPEVLLMLAEAKKPEGGYDMSKIDVVSLLPAMADAIHSLSDDDAERIVRTSLKYVLVQQSGGLWTAVMNQQGGLQFALDLKDMLEIAWKVIEGNLASFFPTAP